MKGMFVAYELLQTLKIFNRNSVTNFVFKRTEFALVRYSEDGYISMWLFNIYTVCCLLIDRTEYFTYQLAPTSTEG